MIVADASWVVALSDQSDAHHLEAVAIKDSMAGERVLLHPLTLAECLVAPAKIGDVEGANVRLRAAFEVPDVDADAPRRWAILSAETGLRLPDAIVIDTALRHKARAIATFDRKLAAEASRRQIQVDNWI